MDPRAGEDAVTTAAPGPAARPAAAPAAPLRSRRRLLGAALSAVALAAVAGCGLDPRSIRWDDDTPVPRPTPDGDELARRRTVQTARDLRASSEAATALVAAQVAVVQEVAQQHVQHLVALGAAEATPSTPAETPTGSPSASPSSAPQAPSALVAAHDAARRQAAADAATVSGRLARLLTLVAAARAVQAQRLAGALGAAPPAGTPALPLLPAPESTSSATTGPTGAGPAATTKASPATGADPGTPAMRDAERAALEALTEGELSAVYGYGVLAARLTGPERTRALAALAEHAASAREVADVLRRGEVEPPPGAPAYELPGPVDTPAQARAAAAGIESALVSLTADLTAATDGHLRAAAVDLTVRRALAAAGWGAAPAAFPGTA